MNENSHTYIRFLVAFLLLKFRYKEIISYNLLAEIDCPDHSYCSYWKSVGYCQYGNQYYSFLKAYCPATCGICGKYAIHVRIRPHISFSTKCGGPGPPTPPLARTLDPCWWESFFVRLIGWVASGKGPVREGEGTSLYKLHRYVPPTLGILGSDSLVLYYISPTAHNIGPSMFAIDLSTSLITLVINSRNNAPDSCLKTCPSLFAENDHLKTKFSLSCRDVSNRNRKKHLPRRKFW